MYSLPHWSESQIVFAKAYGYFCLEYNEELPFTQKPNFPTLFLITISREEENELSEEDEVPAIPKLMK